MLTRKWHLRSPAVASSARPPCIGASSCCVRPSLPSSATTLDLRSSVCIRLMDTSPTLSHSLPKHRLGVAENTMVRSRANPLAQAPAPCLGLVSHLFHRKARDSSVRQLPPPEAGEDGAPCQRGTLPVLLRILEFLNFSSVLNHLFVLPGQGTPLTQNNMVVLLPSYLPWPGMRCFTPRYQ